MKYPTLRYGNPAELAYYVQGIPIKHVARRLKRSERCIRNYLSGAQKMPWWIPEIIRLQNLEADARMRQMNMQPVARKLGLVKTAGLYEFPRDEPPPCVEVEVCENTLPLFATG